MMRTLGCLLGVGLTLSACNAYHEGEDGNADEQICESAQAEVEDVCFYDDGANTVEGAARPSITDVAATAVMLNGGFYLRSNPVDEPTDQVGFVLEENASRRVACLLQCDLTIHSLCVTALEPGEGSSPTGCFFCGVFEQEECQDFIDSCM